jgi:hypothetical protein
MTTVPARHDTPTDTDTSGLPPGLDGPARAWLTDALTEAAQAAQVTEAAQAAEAEAASSTGGTVSTAWQVRFAEAGRRCGPGHADAARVELLAAARPGGAALTALYRQGSAAERRAVLLALGRLEPAAGEGLALVEDALRTNDTSLVAAALGPYAAAHLPAHAWRHGVLKCLFTGVPVAAVAGLSVRARGDGELGRMLRADLTRVLALTEEP